MSDAPLGPNGFVAVLDKFAHDLTGRSVLFQEEPFELRAGGFSNWYIDTRRGLASADIGFTAGELVVFFANDRNIEWDVVAGIGVGGRAVTSMTVLNSQKKQWAHGNDDKSDKDLLNGYGFHGAPLKGKRVLGVDDIASTGDSAVTTVNMVRDEGGEITDFITISERSNGKAAEALAELGVRHHYLLEFVESKGILVPAV